MLWDHCMHRNPYELGRARISAIVLAEILNDFVEAISWKTISVVSLIFFGTLIAANTRVRRPFTSRIDTSRI